LAEGRFFLRRRQEHAVEREVLWGTTKLRVDRGHVVDVGEALVAAEAERARAHSSCDELFFSM
jgi:hypothetical protein